MQVTIVEGIVKDAQIQLTEDVKLPESARIYVVISPIETVKKIMSPRFANKADAKRFVKIIAEDVDDELL